MKQFTVRLSDEEAIQLDFIIKECSVNSFQAAFELMVKNYLYCSQSSEALLRENDYLSQQMHQMEESYSSKIELLTNIILRATGRDLSNDLN